MKRIIIYNNAGGAGKTTTALNLGYELGQKGKKVLLVDTDSQSDLTGFLGVNEEELEYSVADLMLGKASFTDVVLKDVHGIDLIPSKREDVMDLPQLLTTTAMNQTVLRDCIEDAEIEEEYDFLLIDCPASMSLIVENVLAAAEQILIPVPCNEKGLKSTDSMFDIIYKTKKRLNRSLKILGFVPTFYTKSTSSGVSSLKEMEDLSQAGKVFSAISRTVALEDSFTQQLPLALVKKGKERKRMLDKKTRMIYSQLADEILEVL